MAFRKRNVVPTRGGTSSPGPNTPTSPGIRPSPLTSHPVTSTGTPSLDDLLGGHSGLPLGHSILIEESGTTDYAGALLRSYAAEGLCQGHVVHVVGLGEGWVRELPGVAEGRKAKGQDGDAAQRMRIAWRYERLGVVGERALPNRSTSTPGNTMESQQQIPFSHTFDLTKRVTIPPNASINHIPLIPTAAKPFDTILQSLTHHLKTSPPGTVHRLIIPLLLSPALWPPHVSQPEHILRFLHALRALHTQYPTTLTAMLTLPLSLLPRTSGLCRWAEILSDGVVELTPFPHSMDAAATLAESGGTRSGEEQPQGMVRVRKLPVGTERGEGGAGVGNSLGEDLAFVVSRRRFGIRPFSLPPVEGDTEAQGEAAGLKGRDVEF
ncbi:PAXNEB-domain-containing protein [Teratosphaeria nubilosa]|uniref:Elongator complex protein 4 n=1 Tax=Teratosphaeria nubilosa TaxID=161662 RepID=A0A6G1LIJ8_9PEZI|nr:PAXNEB-domain-containing protein [Teratosphaeria nubilosa]